MEILNKMLTRAQANPQRIVLPEGDESRTLEAAEILLAKKAVKLILIGNPQLIAQQAQEKGLSHINEATIIDPLNNPDLEKYASLLCELRKAKGMTIEEARKKACRCTRHNSGYDSSRFPDTEDTSRSEHCERCFPYDYTSQAVGRKRSIGIC